MDFPVEFEILIKAGLYEKTPDRDKMDDINRYLKENQNAGDNDLPVNFCLFTRHPLEFTCKIAIDEKGNVTIDGRNCSYMDLLIKDDDVWAKLFVVKRKVKEKGARHIITVSITNELKKKKRNIKRPEFCIFQPEIILYAERSIFLPFTNQALIKEDRPEEIKSLQLQYLKYASFASGHGCAASWEDYEKSEMPLSDWLKAKKYVRSEIIPTYEVAMSDVDFRDSDRFEGIRDILDLRRLLPVNYGGINKDVLLDELKQFIDRYDEWIDGERKRLEEYLTTLGIDEIEKRNTLQNRANKNLDVCKALYTRMLNGIKTLKKNEKALNAFRDANLAIYLQRAFGKYIKTKKSEKESQKLYTHLLQDRQWVEDYNTPPPDIDGFVKQHYEVRWRPFELAFLLSQICGMVDDACNDRSTADLIWFSTGGGKTEAYLGLVAFTIFYRRLAYPEESGGVTALMRYTMRLLNKQQFSRAVPLICACELIRKTYRNTNAANLGQPCPDYGNERISIGIWVGASLMPNKWESNGDIKGFWEASKIMMHDSIRDINDDDVKYSLPLSECPCCGARLMMDKDGNHRKGRWGIIGSKVVVPYNRDAHYSQTGYLICTNKNCHFGISDLMVNNTSIDLYSSFYLPLQGEDSYNRRNRIKDIIDQACDKINQGSGGFPVYFVDETIYEKKPTLLFSTIDKYASINWKLESFRLFNLCQNDQDNGYFHCSRPPELIIQDELHLISSALGSIYGVYEIAIDELCTRRINNTILKPKIVGATATSRNAENQCNMLYGRSSFMQFPPPALDADDSFYSRKKPVDYVIPKEDREGFCRAFGRLYLGIMPSGFTHTVTMIRLVSVLTQLIHGLDENDEVLDKYYNVLLYFNSLKELGKFRTLVQDDIPAYRKTLGLRTGTVYQGYDNERFIELSSQLSGDEIQTNLDNLEKTCLSQVRTQVSKNQKEALLSIGVLRKSDVLYQNNSLHDEFIDFIQFLDRDRKMILFKLITGQEYYDDEDNLNKALLDKIKILLDPAEDNNVKQLTGATNMISVGVDIPRLNIIEITGQPKMHAEYIQASSRVGRYYPGIVLATYNSAKNRDRSHYEKFSDFHRAFYKDVESNSVTPYSVPALEKALHSVVYALMRKEFFGDTNDATITTSNENEVNAALDRIQQFIIQRLNNFGAEEAFGRNVNEILTTIKENWKTLSQIQIFYPEYDYWSSSYFDDKLYYDPEKYLQMLNNPDAPFFGIKKAAMTSLRNVENNTSIQIKRYN